MKKLILILAAVSAIFLISCKSEIEKAEDIIRAYMFETLYDYDSYQPISTEKDVIDYKHKFRCKTAGGLSRIHTWKFVLDFDEGRVRFYYDDNGELQFP